MRRKRRKERRANEHRTWLEKMGEANMFFSLVYKRKKERAKQMLYYEVLRKYRELFGKAENKEGAGEGIGQSNLTASESEG